MIGAVFSKGSDLKLTRADVEKIRYASQAIRLGKNPQRLTILGGIEGTQLDWVSGARQIIGTRYGRVVKTVGLPDDLRGTTFVTPDPLALDMMEPDRSYSCGRSIDLAQSHQYGMLVESTFKYAGRSTLPILGTPFTTDVWHETGSAPEIDWSFTNIFWRDSKTGFVWKSIQHATPDLPSMELIVLRPGPKV